MCHSDAIHITGYQFVSKFEKTKKPLYVCVNESKTNITTKKINYEKFIYENYESSYKTQTQYTAFRHCPQRYRLNFISWTLF